MTSYGKIFIIAPSHPILFFINHTATTIFLMWSTPERANGIIRHYQIEYGVTRNQWEDVIVDPSPLYYTITGLLPAHLYYVRVAAFTVERGNYSNIDNVFLDEGSKYNMYIARKKNCASYMEESSAT